MQFIIKRIIIAIDILFINLLLYKKVVDSKENLREK